MVLEVELDTFNAHLFGYDPRIYVFVGLARTLWLRGLSPRQAGTKRTILYRSETCRNRGSRHSNIF
jgi:hypothetical protein